MIKILVILLFAVTFSHKAHSTHIIGGELSYECINPAPINSYEFTLKWYRDCSDIGNIAFDSTIYMTIYDSTESLVASIPLLLPPTDTLENIPTADYCLKNPVAVCVEMAIYASAYTFGPSFEPGGYFVSFQRCCRNNNIVNLLAPLSRGMSLYLTIPDTGLANCNSSPQFMSPPPTYICPDRPFSYNHSATDPDGDSLVYSICAPSEYNLSKYGPFPTPSPGPGFDPGPGPPSENQPVLYLSPFSALNPMGGGPDSVQIDPQSGMFTVTPVLEGQFVVGVCVSEYRDGQLLSISKRDYQYHVVAFCDTIPAIDFISDTQAICLGGSILFTPIASDTIVNHQWDFGDSFTSNNASPQHIYTVGGSYDVSLEADFGGTCNNKIVKSNYVFADASCSILGLPLISGGNQNIIQVIPNPFSNQAEIRISDQFLRDHQSASFSMAIYDVMGKEVMRFTQIEHGKVILEAKDLPRGLYFYQLYDDGVALYSGKVQVMK